MKSSVVIALGCVSLMAFSSCPALAQIPMSGVSYSQNFDSLGSTGTINWTNNVTISGWYASKGNGDATNYVASTGTSTTGAIYSYGASSNSERALGSVAGTSTTYAYGVRFTNNTATGRTNITVSYTGEQWRSGSVTTPQTLAFSYQVANSPITNTYSGSGWINFTALDFVSPNLSGASSAIDGNASTNRQVLTSIVLTGVVVQPGQELFLRWLDVDDTGFDNALAIDNLTIYLGDSVAPSPPSIETQPESQTIVLGANVTYSISAVGSLPLSYQWRFNGTNLPGATASSLSLTNVTFADAGDYLVIVTNAAGSTNSQTATLTVISPPVPGFSLLTWNVKGNGATDWSTNAPQVQAIARMLQYLQPDIVTFNEIPWDLRYEMTNFIAAFLPGFHLAVSTGTDGSICSAIASRFSITRSNSWLDSIDLRGFGYSNANNSLDNFTRDLYEAQITVPNFPRPLHVFTTHLKASSGTNYADNAAKRAAEAAAITNFFATNLFVLYPYDPYTLSGDLNDSDTNTLAIQRLISPATGLRLTNPKNPVTASINTFPTTSANPSERIDFIFPNGLLAANISNSFVFRTDMLNPVPPNLNSNDCKVASDHLPVLMGFNNPYDKPFQLLSVTRTSPAVTLKWESVFGQTYRVDASTNLTSWSTLASNVVATGTNLVFSTNLNDALRFFRIYRVP